MPAAFRVQTWVLILSPQGEGGLKAAVSFGRMACRAAHEAHLVPIFPLVQCLAFMTEEEFERDYERACAQWSRRVGRVWVCLQPESVDLDPATHDILIHNEGRLTTAKHYSAPSRSPVYRFWVQDNGAVAIERFEREEINQLLYCNVTSGLFRGAAVG